jgi:hypothetical protein
MKIYSNEYIKDFDKLKNSVIGFEFEFYTDRSYYKLLELLNNELAPIKTSGFRKYHSDFKPDENNFKIEPDLSMGPQGVEYITGPIPYTNAKLVLLKILKILEKYARTDEKCSLHINISFEDVGDGKVLNNLNKLKLILEVDEDYIYNFFPERKNNIYAKTVKSLIPFKGYDYSTNAVELLQNNIQLSDTKYYGLNFKPIENIDTVGQRLECRYIGGLDYHKKTADILSLMDYFIALTWNCCNSSLDEDDLTKLQEYLFKNINIFKSFNNYDDFVAEFPTIDFQVDKISEYGVIKAYYDTVFDEVYEMMRNIYNLKDCIINLDTQVNRLEVVDATFKTIFDIDNIDFIECSMNSGRYTSCNFISSELINGTIHGGDIMDSDIFNSKIENAKIDRESEVSDCYLYQCYVDSAVKGNSVLRMCQIGPNAIIEDSVKIATDMNNYFNTKTVGDDKKDTGVQDLKNMKIPDIKGKKW